MKKSKKQISGWLLLAEKNLVKIWDNRTDEEEWSKYL